MHRDFLHGILGVSRRAPIAAVLAELGTYPLAVFWARIAARLPALCARHVGERPVRWAATYWRVPRPDTDEPNTED